MESMPAALPRDDDFMLGGLTARATGRCRVTAKQAETAHHHDSESV
jgi:hypothetical protein